jgi:hypothetical protein
MKSLILVLSLWLVALRGAHGQGIVSVSNLGLAPSGNATIASNAWIAQMFFIVASDTNSYYLLNSVQLLLNSAAGNPNGFSVAIYNSGATGAPQHNLGSLVGSSSPAAGGIYTYSASGIRLVPGIFYFVVASAASALGQGAFNWSAANGGAVNGNLEIDDWYFGSSNGVNWDAHARQSVFQMSVFATPAPEPSALALLALGGVWLLARRRGQNKNQI